MRILTFGSCLSRYIAESYCDMFGGELISATFHNRIDQFNGAYVRKDTKLIPLEYMDQFNLSPENKEFLLNQYSEGTLGRHMLPDGENMLDALRKGVDLIISDNFVDLCFRLLDNNDYPGSKVFVNSTIDKNLREKFEVGDLLEIDKAISEWDYFGHYLWKMAPNAKRFFVNFPYNHHDNKNIAKRSLEFSSNFSTKKFDVIPNIDVPRRYMLAHTQSHFANDLYAMYAGIISFRATGLHLTTVRK